jgi:hypothetical protein
LHRSAHAGRRPLGLWQVPRWRKPQIGGRRTEDPLLHQELHIARDLLDRSIKPNGTLAGSGTGSATHDCPRPLDQEPVERPAEGRGDPGQLQRGYPSGSRLDLRDGRAVQVDCGGKVCLGQLSLDPGIGDALAQLLLIKLLTPRHDVRF